jgi:hypothetical protein
MKIKDKTNLDKIIENLINDPNFSIRTAKAVLEKTGRNQENFEIHSDIKKLKWSPYIAAAVIFCMATTGLLLSGSKQEIRDAHKFTDSSFIQKVSYERSDAYWEETDKVIEYSLSRR